MTQVDLRQNCLVTRGENAVKARAVEHVSIMLSNELIEEAIWQQSNKLKSICKTA